MAASASRERARLAAIGAPAAFLSAGTLKVHSEKISGVNSCVRAFHFGGHDIFVGRVFEGAADRALEVPEAGGRDIMPAGPGLGLPAALAMN